MKSYLVFAPDGSGDPLETVFVKDGWSWPAFLLPIVWLPVRRMWLVLIGYLIVMIGLGALADAFEPAGIAVLGFHALFALEANNLRAWTLGRRGYRQIGVVTARNLEEAEIVYFVESMPTREDAPEPTRPAGAFVPRAPVAATPDKTADDVIGLFPNPEGSAR